MFTVGTRVQFMVMDYRIHSPVLAGVIVETPSHWTENYTVLANTIVWATSYVREAVENDAMIRYELPWDRLAVLQRRSARLEAARLNRERQMGLHDLE